MGSQVRITEHLLEEAAAGAAPGDAGWALPTADAIVPDIQVVGRSASILRLFSPAKTSVRAADLESVLGMQRSTAHRYLTSLLGAGFLERNEDGSYALGPLLVQVGTIALDSHQILDVADSFLRRLTSNVHETTVLSLWGGLGPVVAHVVEDLPSSVHIQVRVGTTLSADSAQGKVFLAFLKDRATIARAVAHLPIEVTERLEQELPRVRSSELGINTNVARGLRTIAAPVFDRRGRIHAAMGIVGTTSSISEDPQAGMTQALRQTAQDLSQQLGWQNGMAGL